MVVVFVLIASGVIYQRARSSVMLDYMNASLYEANIQLDLFEYIMTKYPNDEFMRERVVNQILNAALLVARNKPDVQDFDDVPLRVLIKLKRYFSVESKFGVQDNTYGLVKEYLDSIQSQLIMEEGRRSKVYSKPIKGMN